MQRTTGFAGKIRRRNLANITGASHRLRAAVAAVVEAVEPRVMLSTVIVNTTANSNDNGVGGATVSLLDAITYENANGGGTIGFASSLAGQTISLSSVSTASDNTAGPSDFGIYSNITIASLTSSSGVTLSNSGPSRLFYIGTQGSLTLENLTLTGGDAVGGSSGVGGGAAGMGGAIFNQGTLTIQNSTLDGNTAQGGAGADYQANANGNGGGGLGGNSVNSNGGGPNGGTNGGNGGFGGGGSAGTSQVGGTGGFGGGGGAIGNGLYGGDGGFGGGAGNGDDGAPGFGGGGNGSDGGGGGAGMGGAIFNAAGIVTVNNSSLNQNSADGGKSGGNGASGYGGAVFNLNGTLSLTDDILAYNSVAAGAAPNYGASAGSAAGGAVYSLGQGGVVQYVGGPAVGSASAALLVANNTIFVDSTGGIDLVNNGSAVIGSGNLDTGSTGLPAGISTTTTAVESHITQIEPASGSAAGGDMVTLSGLFDVTGDYSVTFDGVSIAAQSASSQQITFVLPAMTTLISDGATLSLNNSIAFQNADGTASNAVGFNYDAPVIFSAAQSSPVSDAGGSVTLNGYGIVLSDGGYLLVGGQTIASGAIQSQSLAQITFTAPALSSLTGVQVSGGDALVPVQVTNPDGQVSNTLSLSYQLPTPTITTITGGPVNIGTTTEVPAAGGTTITISGGGLYNATSTSLTLTVNGTVVPVTEIQSLSTGGLTFTMPNTVNEVGAGGAIASLTFTDDGLTSNSMPLYIGITGSLVVTSTDDNANPAGYLSNDNSLRDAIAYAQTLPGNQTISFASNVTGTITLGSVLTIDDPNGTLTIAGPGANALTISGNDASTVFDVTGGTAEIDGLTIANGYGTGDQARAGGIYNDGTLTLNDDTVSGNSIAQNANGGQGGGIDNSGTLTVNSSTFYGNSAYFNGGAIYLAEGTATISNSTFSDNSAIEGDGGAIDNESNLAATITNCTIVGNSAFPSSGGGIYAFLNLTLKNSIVADNTGGEVFAGSSFTTTNYSNDLIGPDGASRVMNGANGNIIAPTIAALGLGTLGSYGGTTETIPLLPGSLAIGAATPVAGITADQRGETRSATAPDIGAFESQGFTITPISGDATQSAQPGAAFANPLGVTVTANNPVEPVTGGVITYTVTPAADGASAALSTATAAIASDGTAGVSPAVTAAANSTPGTYTVTAAASGAATPGSFNLTNINSTVVSSSAPNPSPAFYSIPFTATVTTPQGAPATGTVEFQIDGNTVTDSNNNPLVFTLVNGQASYTDNEPSVGILQVTAVYSGGGTPASTSAAYAQVVQYDSAIANPPGTTSSAGLDDSTTQLANAGFYVSTYGATIATAAPSGYYVNYTGATAPTIDPAGTYSVKNPLSQQGPILPTPASLGNYVPNAGATMQTAAQPGYYVASAGATAATPADAGYYVPLSAAIAEIQDPTGTTSGPAASQATATTVTVNPINITYGTALSNTLLLGTSPPAVPGTFAFTTAAGTTLSAGNNQSESVTFTPNDQVDFATVVTSVSVSVSRFVPALTVTNTGGVYTGNPFAVTATVTGIGGVPTTSLEGESPVAQYYVGTYTNSAQLTAAHVTALASAPTDVGAYTAVVGFSGGDTNDYGGTPFTFANFSITAATPTVTLTAQNATSSSNPYSSSNLSPTVTGVSSTTLSTTGVTYTYYTATGNTLGSSLATAPSAIGTYAVVANYPGDGVDYAPASSQPAFFSITAPQTISGTVFNDLNGNGVMDAGDPGVAGDQVQLSFLGIPILTTTTNPQGQFSFTLSSFPHGNYTLLVQTPAGYVATTPTQQNFVISNSSNETLPSVGLFQTVSVSGNAFLDTNGDPGMAGTTIALSNASGATIATMTTNSSGAYSFNDLGPGTFSVSETVPSGYIEISPTPVPPGSYAFNTSSGANITGDSFGNIPAVPTVNVQSSLGQATFGASVKFTATVTAANSPLTAGSVTFSEGATVLASNVPLNSSGQATFTTSSLSASSSPQIITATYNPIAPYQSGAGTFAETVKPATPMVTAADPGGVYDGLPFAATGAVTAPGLSTTPTSFSYVGTGSTVYVASATAPTNAGTYTVTASYTGVGNYASAASTAVPFTISAASTSVAVKSSLSGSAYYGESVTLTAAVSVLAPGKGTLVGSVQFFSNGTSLGTVALSGATATLTTASLTIGSDAITATYIPSSTNFATSTNAAALSQTVSVGLLLLDSSGSGSLTVSGAAKVVATGNSVVVDSSSATAINVSGSASVSDSLTAAVGKASITGAGKVSSLQTGQAKVADPFASLTTPTTAGLTTRSTSTDSIAAASVVTLQPGIYIGGISIAGAAKVTLAPGEYYLQGGGFNVAGSAVVTGTGVFLYNAPTKSTDQFTVSGAAALSLTPMTTGAWAGITLFQARTANNAIDISGSGAVDVTGDIYAADATVDISGAAAVDAFGNSLIAYDLNDSGSGELLV